MAGKEKKTLTCKFCKKNFEVVYNSPFVPLHDCTAKGKFIGYNTRTKKFTKTSKKMNESKNITKRNRHVSSAYPNFRESTPSIPPSITWESNIPKSVNDFCTFVENNTSTPDFKHVSKELENAVSTLSQQKFQGLSFSDSSCFTKLKETYKNKVKSSGFSYKKETVLKQLYETNCILYDAFPYTNHSYAQISGQHLSTILESDNEDSDSVISDMGESMLFGGDVMKKNIEFAKELHLMKEMVVLNPDIKIKIKDQEWNTKEEKERLIRKISSKMKIASSVVLLGIPHITSEIYQDLTKPEANSLKSYYNITQYNLHAMVRYYSAFIWMLFYIDQSGRQDTTFHDNMMACIEKMKNAVDEYGKLNYLVKSRISKETELSDSLKDHIKYQDEYVRNYYNTVEESINKLKESKKYEYFRQQIGQSVESATFESLPIVVQEFETHPVYKTVFLIDDNVTANKTPEQKTAKEAEINKLTENRKQDFDYELSLNKVLEKTDRLLMKKKKKQDYYQGFFAKEEESLEEYINDYLQPLINRLRDICPPNVDYNTTLRYILPTDTLSTCIQKLELEIKINTEFILRILHFLNQIGNSSRKKAWNLLYNRNHPFSQFAHKYITGIYRIIHSLKTAQKENPNHTISEIAGNDAPYSTDKLNIVSAVNMYKKVSKDEKSTLTISSLARTVSGAKDIDYKIAFMNTLNDLYNKTISLEKTENTLFPELVQMFINSIEYEMLTFNDFSTFNNGSKERIVSETAGRNILSDQYTMLPQHYRDKYSKIIDISKKPLEPFLKDIKIFRDDITNTLSSDYDTVSTVDNTTITFNIHDILSKTALVEKKIENFFDKNKANNTLVMDGEIKNAITVFQFLFRIIQHFGSKKCLLAKQGKDDKEGVQNKTKFVKMIEEAPQGFHPSEIKGLLPYYVYINVYYEKFNKYFTDIIGDMSVKNIQKICNTEPDIITRLPGDKLRKVMYVNKNIVNTIIDKIPSDEDFKSIVHKIPEILEYSLDDANIRKFAVHIFKSKIHSRELFVRVLELANQEQLTEIFCPQPHYIMNENLHEKNRELFEELYDINSVTKTKQMAIDKYYERKIQFQAELYEYKKKWWAKVKDYGVHTTKDMIKLIGLGIALPIGVVFDIVLGLCIGTIHITMFIGIIGSSSMCFILFILLIFIRHALLPNTQKSSESLLSEDDIRSDESFEEIDNTLNPILEQLYSNLTRTESADSNLQQNLKLLDDATNDDKVFLEFKESKFSKLHLGNMMQYAKDFIKTLKEPVEDNTPLMSDIESSTLNEESKKSMDSFISKLSTRISKSFASWNTNVLDTQVNPMIEESDSRDTKVLDTQVNPIIENSGPDEELEKELQMLLLNKELPSEQEVLDTLREIEEMLRTIQSETNDADIEQLPLPPSSQQEQEQEQGKYDADMKEISDNDEKIKENERKGTLDILNKILLDHTIDPDTNAFEVDDIQRGVTNNIEDLTKIIEESKYKNKEDLIRIVQSDGQYYLEKLSEQKGDILGGKEISINLRNAVSNIFTNCDTRTLVYIIVALTNSNGIENSNGNVKNVQKKLMNRALHTLGEFPINKTAIGRIKSVVEADNKQLNEMIYNIYEDEDDNLSFSFTGVSDYSEHMSIAKTKTSRAATRDSASIHSDAMDHINESDVYFIPQLEKSTENYLNSVKPVKLEYRKETENDENEGIVQNGIRKITRFFTSTEVEAFQNKYRSFLSDFILHENMFHDESEQRIEILKKFMDLRQSIQNENPHQKDYKLQNKINMLIQILKSKAFRESLFEKFNSKDNELIFGVQAVKTRLTKKIESTDMQLQALETNMKKDGTLATEKTDIDIQKNISELEKNNAKYQMKHLESMRDAFLQERLTLTIEMFVKLNTDIILDPTLSEIVNQYWPNKKTLIKIPKSNAIIPRTTTITPYLIKSRNSDNPDHGQVILVRDDKTENNEQSMLDYFGVDSTLAMLHDSSLNVNPELEEESKGKTKEDEKPKKKLQKLEKKTIDSKVDISLLLS